MSTGESYDPRLLMDIKWDPEPTQDEILINYLWRLKEQAEATYNDEELVEITDDTVLGLYFDSYGNEIGMRAGTNRLPLGYYSPPHKDIIIYPEFLLPGERDKLRRIGMEYRTNAINNFNRLKPRDTRFDRDHEDVSNLFLEQDHALRETGLASSVLTGQRMKVKASDDGLYFDEYTQLTVRTSELHGNYIYLHMLGPIKNKGGFVKRIAMSELLIATANPKSPYLDYMPQEGMVNYEELLIVLGLVDSINKVKESHPTFDTHFLGIRVTPQG
jgi:hypothetical protein